MVEFVDERRRAALSRLARHALGDTLQRPQLLTPTLHLRLPRLHTAPHTYRSVQDPQ